MRRITNSYGPQEPDDDCFDVKLVFDYVKEHWSENGELSISDLTDKCLVLCALCFGARPVDLSRTQVPTLESLQNATQRNPAHLLLDPKNRRCRSDVLRGVLEYRKVSFHPFTSEPALCLCSCLAEYIIRTAERRKADSLLFLYTDSSSSKSLSSDRISNRITRVLRLCGIVQFTARHCKRSGTTALIRDGDYLSMLAYGDWKDAQVARRHYDKTVFSFNDAWAAMREN